MHAPVVHDTMACASVRARHCLIRLRQTTFITNGDFYDCIGPWMCRLVIVLGANSQWLQLNNSTRGVRGAGVHRSRTHAINNRYANNQEQTARRLDRTENLTAAKVRSKARRPQGGTAAQKLQEQMLHPSVSVTTNVRLAVGCETKGAVKSSSNPTENRNSSNSYYYCNSRRKHSRRCSR